MVRKLFTILIKNKYLKQELDHLAKSVIRFALRYNLPQLAAVVCYSRTKVLKDGGKRPNVLCLSKSFFNEDVKALCKFGDKFNYCLFPRLYLNTICSFFISSFDSLNDGNYHINVNENHNIHKLRTFLYRLLIHYKRMNKFDVVLAGNFVYTQQQELFLVLKELGIPSVVIYKEGMFPVSRYDEMIEKIYKTKEFRADKILLYNNKIKDTLIKARIPGLVEEKTVVVGIPRFDFYKLNDVKEENNTIVLFSFEPKVKASYLLNDKQRQNEFVAFSDHFHKMFAMFISTNPEYRLIVKTKPSESAVAYASKMFGPYVEKLKDRLEIIANVSAERLVKRASFVAAFSSTTLIEGLMLDKILICPNVKEMIGNEAFDILYPYNGLATYVSSVDALQETIESRRSDFKEKRDVERVKYLESMVHEPFSNSSEVVEKELLKLLEGRLSRGD